MRDSKKKLKKTEVERLKIENADLKYLICSTIVDKPVLPIDAREKSKAVHFYTSACGRHMSARIVEADGLSEDELIVFGLLAFHEGKFDIFQPKLPKIFAKYRGEDIPLIEDTEATYKQLPHDILNSITSFVPARLPQGVIRIYLGTIPMYTMRCLKIVTFYTK